MKADDFLTYSGQYYDTNKKKWAARLKKLGYQFSEDIYNDTILKVYDYLSKIEKDMDIEAFWYQAFLTNTKREAKYYYHNRDDSIDVLKYLDEFPTDDKPLLLEDIQDVLQSMEDNKNFHLFFIYYMTDTTYAELEELTGVKDIRYKIKSIGKKIRECIKRKGLQ